MLLIELLLSLIIALVFVVIFGIGIRKMKPGRQVAIFFITLVLATWAGGIWLRPFGPTVLGVSLLAFVVAGYIASIMLALFYPNVWDFLGPKSIERSVDDPDQVIRMSILLWLLLLGLVAAIVAGHLALFNPAAAGL